MRLATFVADLSVEKVVQEKCKKDSRMFGDMIRAGELGIWQFRSLYSCASISSLDIDSTITAMQF